MMLVVRRLVDSLLAPLRPPAIRANQKGVAYLERAKWNEAIAAFDQAIQRDPHFAIAFSNRSLCRYYLGEFVKAIEDANQAVALNSSLAEAFSNRGLALSGQGHFKAAIDDLSRAIELNPSLPYPHLNRGIARVNDRQYEQAVFDSGLVSSPVSQSGRGSSLSCRGRTPDFSISTSHLPISTSRSLSIRIWRRNTRTEHLSCASLAGSRKRRPIVTPPWSEILKKPRLTRCAETSPWNVVTSRPLWLSSTPPSKSSQSTRPIYIGRGLAWDRLGQLEKAMQEYDRGLEINPNDGILHNNLGYALVQLERYDEASGHYTKAIELAPRHPNAYKNFAWLKATCPQAGLRDGNEAVALATKAVELAGQCPPAWLEILAAAYAEQGNFAEAVRWQTEAVAAASDKKKNEQTARLHRYQSGMPHRI